MIGTMVLCGACQSKATKMHVANQQAVTQTPLKIEVKKLQNGKKVTIISR